MNRHQNTINPILQMRAVKVREVTSLQQATQPVNGRWVWSSGWPGSKACPLPALLYLSKPILKRKTGWAHMGPACWLQNEEPRWPNCGPEIRQVQKRTDQWKKYSETEKGTVPMHPPPRAFNNEVDFGQRGLKSTLPALSNASKCTGLICKRSLRLSQAAMC